MPAEAALDGFPGARVEVLRPSQVSPQALTVTFPASGSMYELRSLSASTVFANALASTFLGAFFSAAAGPGRGRRRRTASTRPRSVASSRWPFQLCSARVMNARISATSSRVTRPRFARTVEAEAASGRLAATRASRSADRLRPHR